jgi:HTH-type transcriptional regulator/antitoxin HipB
MRYHVLINSPKDLALLIINQRKKLKLSQSKIGDLVGLRQATISAFEKHPEHTKIEALFQILSVVNLNIEVAPKSEFLNKQDKWDAEW